MVRIAIVLLCGAAPAAAQSLDAGEPVTRNAAMWQHLFEPSAPLTIGRATVTSVRLSDTASPLRADNAAKAAPAQPPPKAFEYSEGYETRRKIHYYASFATLPLFVTQYVLGDKLFDRQPSESGGSTKSAHSATAIGIEALFGINSVTGIWNLWEARHDPNGRKLRLTHGLLMLAADAGFVTTGLMTPDEDGTSGRSAHRNVAIVSMGVATVSYLIMLVGR